MYYKSKYIVIDEMPVVFTELLTHSDIARSINPHAKIDGAGFCFIENNKYICYGESISLKVKSREAIDSAILNKLLGASNEM